MKSNMNSLKIVLKLMVDREVSIEDVNWICESLYGGNREILFAIILPLLLVLKNRKEIK
jgi:hypothetical protein